MKHSSSLTRRNFLTLAGVVPAALAAGSVLDAAAADSTDAAVSTKSPPIGLELYSVRGELSKDLPKTLKTVAGYGYQVVEFYSPYFDWKFPYAKEVRAQLDDLGLRCYSTHNGFQSF